MEGDSDLELSEDEVEEGLTVEEEGESSEKDRAEGDEVKLPSLSQNVDLV